jgi:hypothetical protein
MICVRARAKLVCMCGGYVGGGVRYREVAEVPIALTASVLLV